jgi:serine/threonine protein kinase
MDARLVLDRLTLGSLEFLAQGGQGKVWHVRSLSLPDCRPGLVFKEYTTGTVAQHGLERVVSFRSDLTPAERQELDGHSAWPVRLVRDGSDTVGIVMPLIPDTFLQNWVTPGTGTQKSSPREFQFLFIPPTTATKLGFPVVSVDDRFAICAAFARALHFLHHRNIVFGDISSKNGLWSVSSGRAEVMLVDCDAVRVAGQLSAVPALNSPDWFPPASERRSLTIWTDRYKFGLFVLRALKPGDGVSTKVDPEWVADVLDPDGMALLRSALSQDREERPTLAEWVAYFDAGRSGVGSARPPRRPATAPAAQRPVFSGWVRNADGTWKEADGSAGVPRAPRSAPSRPHRGWVRGPDGDWVEKD